MPYFACFKKISGHIFRFDTRIYLGSNYSIDEQGVCVGAIIGKNPGSAVPTRYDQLSRLALNGDKMLPSVKNRFTDAFRNAGLEPPHNAFVRVWNLFYLCNPNLNNAIAKLREIPQPPVCCSEQQDSPPLIWYAWGGSQQALDSFKKRYLNIKANCFYYDKNERCIINSPPKANSFPKHPQGLPGQCVVDYISAVISSQCA